MNFNDPDFQRLIKKAFNSISKANGDEDITARAIRMAATTGKAAVDQGLAEFPKARLIQAVKEIYAQLDSQQLADGVSSALNSVDEAKIKGAVDNFADQLKDPATALQVAKQLQIVLNKTSLDDLETKLDGLMSGRSLNERMVLLMAFAQIKPVLEDMKTARPEKVAATLTKLANNLPSDVIAAQFAFYTQQVLPAKVSEQANELMTGKLPTPKAVADIVYGIGTAASAQLDHVAKTATPADAIDALKQFPAQANSLITDTLAKDAAAKKAPKKPRTGKQGGNFKF